MGTADNPLPEQHTESVRTEDAVIDDSLTYPGGKDITASPIGWEEDGNSPFEVDEESEATYSLDGEYDLIWAITAYIEGSYSEATDLEFYVNGNNTSEWDFMDAKGSITSQEDVAKISEDEPNSSGAGEYRGVWSISGRWNNTLSVMPMVGGNTNTNFIQVAKNREDTSPLESFTLRWNAGDITTRMRVYGAEI